MLKDKERYFEEARKFNKKIFASKDKMRQVWARQPMEVKIRELVKLQEITATLHPELRKIIPWKLQ
jgi:hypothetical protein